MLILITGGASCGKSEYGENLLNNYDKKLYIATMKPIGSEEKEKIKKHKNMRYDKNFKTIEIYENIKDMTSEDSFGGIIFECISNALANEMFSLNKNSVFDIVNAVKYISSKCSAAVVITSEVGLDGIKYDDFTEEYIKKMAEINAKLSDIADAVIEMVFGIPVFLKGEI